MIDLRKPLILLLIIVSLFSCTRNGDKPITTDEPIRSIQVPKFNSDSAYRFVKDQVAFGPRIPNTEAHKRAGDFLIDKLKDYNAEVVVQDFSAPFFDGQKRPLRNIIGVYAPEKKKRILLAAHWDTRPFADKDPETPTAQFEGANDGASGVGVLLELARLLGENDSPSVGVDIIFFDGEDWGEPQSQQDQVKPPEGWDSWWCMGSQYWSKNKHVTNYSAYYGILLDMVGANRSQFFREEGSLHYAPKIVAKVWNTAARLGYSDYFVKQNAHAITDDHVFVNELAKIPMIDIVHYQPGIGYFGDYHHSRKDNIELISKETLEAVGTTVLNVVYYEE